MRSRFAVCVLGFWSLLASAPASAQPTPGTIASPRIYAPAPYDASNSWPAYGVPSYDYFPEGGQAPDIPYGAGPDGLVTERISGDKGFDYEDSPLDRLLTATAKSSWIRVEYLQWQFQGPGQTLLGSPVAGVVDPSKPFQAAIPGQTTNIQPITAQVPTTGALHFENVQGIRGTFGLPTSVGTFEANYFAFDRALSSQFLAVPAAPPLAPQLQVQYATSTFLNGQLSSNLFLYNTSFEMIQNSQLSGTEANWIAVSPYEEGFVTRPFVGFRFLKIHERLFQSGTFIDQLGQLTSPLVSTIDSDVTNRVYAPQLGIRFELVNRWLTLGVEPKVAFGANQYNAGVRTDHLRSPGDPAVSTSAKGTHFTPVGDFSFYGKLHVRDNFSLFGSYQIMVASGVSRPANNIYYNDNGATNPAAIVVDPGFRNMWWQGFTVGGEFRFR